MLFGHGRGAAAKLGRREDVAGLVDERASEVLAFADDDALVPAALGIVAALVVAVLEEHGNGVDAEILAVAAVGVDIEVREDGAFRKRAREPV